MKGGEKIVRYAAIVIAAVTVLSIFAVLTAPQVSPGGVVSTVSRVDAQTSEIADRFVKEIKDGPVISTPLQEIMKKTGEDDKIWVYVVTDDVRSFRKSLDELGVKTPMATNVNAKGPSPIRVFLMQLNTRQILTLSKSPGVLNIFHRPTPQFQDVPQFERMMMEGNTGNVLNPMNVNVRGIYQTLHHGAQDAWSEGIMGSNVTIAIVDTGVDFAQPNLYGSWLVESNASSPYYGWPVVYDPWSVYLYVVYNLTGMDAYSYTGVPSWFVNTSYNTTALPNGTVYFHGHYYNVAGIRSASGHYHLGLLPDVENYLPRYNDVPAVLVVDSTTNYTYDTVYVDLDMDHDFTDEKPTNKSSPVSYRDDYNATSGQHVDSWNGGDGYADWSGGMIYFIADGRNPMPGTMFFAWWYMINASYVPIPGKGDLVAFEGDFDMYPHGTACAANAASRGVTLNGLGVGMAPRAKIIAVPHFWMDGISEWVFSQTGYIIHQYNYTTGDIDGGFYDGNDAQISSNSWGSSYVHWDGWDYNEDRMMDYVAEILPQLYGYYPITSFLVALGNGGPGYGTATSPAAQAAINVAAGSEWGYRQILYGDSTMYDSYYGDVVDFSARGPYANGKATPDILATGEFGITPMALNYPDINGNVGNGASHFDLFSGTSMATPVAAGGLALIYDAFYRTYGTYPTMWTAKYILQSAADDHNYDPLSQGPGWLNVSRAIDMILGKGGIGVTPNVWNVGTYNGNEYEMFPGIVYPGQSISKSITLTNYDWNASHTANVALSGVTYRMDYEYNITVNIPYNAGSVVDLWYNLSNLSVPIPANTDLLQVMTYTDYATLDDPNDTQHSSPNLYYVVTYLWDYINYTSTSNYTDRMRMQVSGGLGNSIDMMLHDPMRRLHGDMWYELRVYRNVAMNMTFHVKIVGYRAVNWNWLSLSASSIGIAGGNGSASVTATITVPNSAKPGIYEGKILVDDGMHVTAVPVVVYVAAQMNTLADVITFGGENLSRFNTYLYDNSHVRGLYDWYWRAEAGDWRFFFLNVSKNVNVNNAYLTVDITWESNLTDIDAFILGNTTDLLSYYFPTFFGPYALHVTGQSKDMYIGGGMYARQTSSGGAREVIAAPLQNGLMEIMLHNVLFSGVNASEKFTVRIYVTTYSPSEFNVDVGKVSGLNGSLSVTFTTYAPTSGLDLRILPMIYVDTSVHDVPISTGEWKYYAYSTAGWKYLAFEAVSSDPANDDIDLYVFYSDDGQHFYYSGLRSATASGDEYVEVGDPSAHPYWLAAIYGYSVSQGCTLNLTVYEGLPDIPQINVTNVPSSITPGVPATFTIEYNFSGYNIMAGRYYSTVYFGPAGSGGIYGVRVNFNALDQEAPSVVPLTTGLIGTAQPTLMVLWNDTGIHSPPKNATWWVDGLKIPDYRTSIDGDYLSAVPQFLLADGLHDIRVYYEDSAGNGNVTNWTIVVDDTPPALTITSPSGSNVGITYNASLWINGTTDPDAKVTINGASVTVDSSGNFAYRATLQEGLNVFTVVATDPAGNNATATVTALYMPQLPQIWKSINDLYARVNSLQTQLNDLNARLNNLSARVNTLSGDVETLKSRVDTLQAQLNDLQNALDENVTSLNSAIENMRTDLIGIINENISAINQRLNDIQGDIDDINQNIAAIEEKNKAQDDAIGMSNVIGYAGIAIAVIALLLAILALMKLGVFGGKGAGGSSEISEEEPLAEATVEDETALEDI